MKLRNRRISVLLWFCSIFLLGMMLLMYSASFSWRLFFWDIKHFSLSKNTINVIKLGAIWFIIELIGAIVFSLFVKGWIKMEIAIRIGKKQKIFKYTSFILKHITVISLFHVAVVIVMIGLFQMPSWIRSRKEWKGDVTIAHAGGAIEGNVYTNTPEAIYLNYEKGHRTFEIDMNFTVDGKLACIHDWKRDLQKARESGIVPTGEDFKKHKIKEKYTPILIDDLFEIMDKYPDIWIVTDTKTTNEQEIRLQFQEMIDVARKLGIEHILDRIVVQIYNEEMYGIVKEVYPFSSWIYTMYVIWDGNIESFESNARFCYKNDIQNITMFGHFLNQGVLDIVDKYNLNIYTHTINDSLMAMEHLELGVDGVYTDNITPNELAK